MGDSRVMTHSRGTQEDEVVVAEAEVTTLPQGSEPTTEPSEGDTGTGSGSGGDGEEEQIKWQGGPNDPPGSGGSGSGNGGSGS